jgi:hypothetical protein
MRVAGRMLYVKKPECPAWKSGDECPWDFRSDTQQVRMAFSKEEAPCGSTGLLHFRKGLRRRVREGEKPVNLDT